MTDAQSRPTQRTGALWHPRPLQPQHPVLAVSDRRSRHYHSAGLVTAMPVEEAGLRPNFVKALELGAVRLDLVVRFGQDPMMTRSLRRSLDAVMVRAYSSKKYPCQCRWTRPALLVMKKHPVTGFYILAFAISWLGLIPGVLGSRGIAPFESPFVQILGILFSIGPALAAVIMSQVMQGKTGVQNLLKGLLKWRVNLVWYLVAVLGPVVIFVAGQVLTKLMGLTGAPAAIPSNPLLFFVAVLTVILSNTSEEIGWRGFALPHLQKRHNALSATLIVGLLWSLWHLPLVLLTGNPMAQSPLIWFISIVASAFIYTWLYNSTQGSILLVALFHGALNIFGAFITGVSPIAYALLNCVVAIILIAVFGKATLSRQKRVYVD